MELISVGRRDITLNSKQQSTMATICDIITSNYDSNTSTGGKKNIVHAFSGQKFKPHLSDKIGGGVLTTTDADGTIYISNNQNNLHSIPPDSLGFIKNNMVQKSKKTKAKKHALNEMYRRQEKRERPVEKKEETQEEMNARFKAMVELIGLEEAKEMMNRDFWA